MKENLLLLACTVVLLIAACKGPAEYELHTSFSSYKASPASIKNGEKTAKLYPDDDIIYYQCYKTLNFHRNTKFDTAAYQFKIKEQYIKKLSWKKNKNPYSLKIRQKLTEEEITALKSMAEGSIGEYLKLSKDSTYLKAVINTLKRTRKKLPDGPVFGSIKSEYSLLNLKDMNELSVTIPYHQMAEVKNISITEGEYSYTPLTIDMPYTVNGIFYSDSRLKHFSMSLPIIGNEGNYEYEELYKDVRFENVCYIQEPYPVEEKSIEINIPDWLDIEIIEKNFEGLKYTKTDQKAVRQPPKKKGKRSKVKTDKKKQAKAATGPGKTITYTFKNLKPYRTFSDSRGVSYNAPHLLFVYKGIKEGKKTTPIFNNSGDLYKWYRTVGRNMENNTERIKPFTENLITDAGSDEEKIRRIFYWIQDNIHYVAFEDGVSGFRPDECQMVFDNRFGDCKGMANLAKHMLKSAGLDARMVWIGTRHLNYDFNTPGLMVNNHAICAVKLKDSFLFIDPTETYCAYGDYAHRIQGRKVIIEDGANFVMDTIPEFGPEHNTAHHIEEYTLSGRTINGTVESIYTGEARTNLLRQYNYLKSQNKDRALYNFLAGNDFNQVVSNIRNSDFNNREQDVSINYDLQVQNHIYRVGDDMLINLDWNREYAGTDIDSSRAVDFNFDMKSSLIRTVTLALPAGYSIKALPPPLIIDNPYYYFSMTYTADAGTITYQKTMTIRQGYLPVSEYKTWNKNIKKLNAFYNDFIILSQNFR